MNDLIFMDAATKIASKGPKDKQEVFIDPITIMLICSILSALFQAIRLYCQIKNKDKAADSIQGNAENMGWFASFLLRRKIIQVIGRSNFAKYGNELMQAIIAYGREMSKEEIMDLWTRFFTTQETI